MKKFILVLEKLFTKKSNIDHIAKKARKKRLCFHGNISLFFPEEYRIGMTVITPNGVGTIFSIDTFFSKSNELTIRLNRGYYLKSYKYNQCYYYAVYNKLLDKFIPLSSQDYTYIIDKHQEIFYSITKRGYAKLLKKYKETHEYINIFNSKRGGRSMLLHLKHEDYKISKMEK